MKNFKYSIIIVYYKNEQDLIITLDSLYEFNPENLFEVIIVDNSEDTSVKSKLTKYKNLIYFNSGRNLGYGSGVNYGAKHAKGEFLFILNPDVVFTQNILSTIYKEFSKKTNIGIVAPLLLNSNKSIMSQGAKNVNFFDAVVKFSFLDKIFPNNFISKKYWTKKWNVNKPTRVDNVPGTAFVIRTRVFIEVGGFDEKFFLYFEEFDLCDRVRALGYEIFIDSRLKLVHKWGTSTKLLENKNEIFIESRNYYFQKKFGLFKSLVLNLFLSININNLIFLLIFVFAASMRIFHLSSVINLGIGDQGWFYLSARDMLLLNELPLVGITSSHLWLHQGALWTYVLAAIFKVFNFNPLSPVFFTVFLDLITLSLVYKLSSRIFNNTTGLVASVFYAFSPYVIMASRMSYHTSLIPFLTILTIYSLYKWTKGNFMYFPLLLLLLALLYNFELQTVIFIFITLLFFVYGLIKKKNWVTSLKNHKIVILSLVSVIIPLIPILIFDLKNGFPQTFVFAGWIIYKASSIFLNSNSEFALGPIVSYFSEFINRLFYIQFSLISLSLFLISSVYGFYRVFIKKSGSFVIIILICFFLVLGIFINKTLSDAYLYSLIIPLILLVSAFLGSIFKSKILNIIFIALIATSLLTNLIYLNTSGYYQAYEDKVKYFSKNEAAKYIVKDSNGRGARLVGKGDGSQFISFLDYYKYLIWFYGGNIDQKSNLIYILYETPSGTKIIKGDRNVKHNNFN